MQIKEIPLKEDTFFCSIARWAKWFAREFPVPLHFFFVSYSVNAAKRKESLCDCIN